MVGWGGRKEEDKEQLMLSIEDHGKDFVFYYEGSGKPLKHFEKWSDVN